MSAHEGKLHGVCEGWGGCGCGWVCAGQWTQTTSQGSVSSKLHPGQGAAQLCSLHMPTSLFLLPGAAGEPGPHGPPGVPGSVGPKGKQVPQTGAPLTWRKEGQVQNQHRRAGLRPLRAAVLCSGPGWGRGSGAPPRSSPYPRPRLGLQSRLQSRTRAAFLLSSTALGHSPHW